MTPYGVAFDRAGTAMYILRVIRTQRYLDAALHRRLRDLADQQGRTVSDLVRAAAATAGLRFWTANREHSPLPDVRCFGP